MITHVGRARAWLALSQFGASMQATEWRRVAGSVLRAPQAGIVEGLSIFTIGGIATAGDELMRIVPSGGELEVEAIFTNQDIGFLTKGQKANIRVDAYPSERFGFIDGDVIGVSADSTRLPDGQWGFVVRIRPKNDALVARGRQRSLRPGMTTLVDVTTDRCRVISYFFAPILRTLENSLGES